MKQNVNVSKEFVAEFVPPDAPAIDKFIVAAFIRRLQYANGLFTRNPDFDVAKADKIFDRFGRVIDKYITQ